MPDEKVTVIVSGECGPCQEVKKHIEEGKFNRPNVELIDITSEEGHAQLDGLVEKLGLNAVPAAYKGTEQCKLGFTENNELLVIDCPGDNEEEPDGGISEDQQ